MSTVVQVFTAGIAIRREIRRGLMTLRKVGVTFEEEKGLINSQFIVEGPEDVLNRFRNIAADHFR